jgi:outer membrane protein assembly factor BamE (lipoprotein component of BamABCDE complex)
MQNYCAIALALVLAGFTVYTPQTPLQDLHVGYTTVDVVYSKLGRPNHRSRTRDGEERWYYVSVNMGPGTQGHGKFFFNDGVLTGCMVHQTVGIFAPFKTECTFY